MRIAMLGPFGLHPNKTMRSRAFGLARPLARRGHQVRLFMPPWQTPAEADRSWQEDGVDFRYVPLRGGVLGITRRLIREVLAWGPELVHAFKPKAYSGLAMLWLWYFYRHRLRLVTDADDWEGRGGWNDLAPYSQVQKRFFARQERWGLTHCHALTVASRTLQSLAWSLGTPPGRVVYVPNGPGIRFGQPGSTDPLANKLKGRPVVLLYSRLFEFDTTRLVAILQEARTAVPDLAVLSVGAGLYEADSARLREMLSAAGLLDGFIDAGWVEEERLPALLASGNVALYLMEDTLLNRAKCPVKLADMLLVGVPVVAEAVGQVTEYVIPRETGLLRRPGDVQGLAADLVYLLTNESERQRLAEGARRLMQERFNWEQLSRDVERSYAEGA